MRGYDSEWLEEYNKQTKQWEYVKGIENKSISSELEWIKENTKNSSVMKGFNNSNIILESEK